MYCVVAAVSRDIREVIGTLWDAALELSLGANRDGFVRTATAELEHALASHARRDEILEGFRALGAEAASGTPR